MAPNGASAFCYCTKVLLTLTLVLGIPASSVNDCRGVKYAYSQKGLDQSDVPRQPRQGKNDCFDFVSSKNRDFS